MHSIANQFTTPRTQKKDRKGEKKWSEQLFGSDKNISKLFFLDVQIASHHQHDFEGQLQTADLFSRARQ